MITHCEECDTYFRVSIDQLKAANGQVKCGCCMTVFNAIESLLENTDASSQQNFPPEADQTENETIGSAILGAEPADEPEDLFTEEIELSDEENDLDNESTENDSPPDENSETIPGKLNSFTEEELSIFGELLDEDELPGHVEKSSNTTWFVTSLIFLGLLILQLITFNLETILAKFPQLQPICHVIDCPAVKVFNDTSAINLISRDVREHPQFRDVLLVNATLMNSTDEFQAFPKLQLDLFNKVGRPVGSRQFSPDEYLDGSTDLEAGMKPKQPVHIVLEILGSAEETRSFEFNFL